MNNDFFKKYGWIVSFSLVITLLFLLGICLLTVGILKVTDKNGDSLSDWYSVILSFVMLAATIFSVSLIYFQLRTAREQLDIANEQLHTANKQLCTAHKNNKKNNFTQTFVTLLAVQQNVFSKRALNEDAFKKCSSIGGREDCPDVFAGFVEYYKVKKYQPLPVIWNNYKKKELRDPASFDACFKFFYNMIALLISYQDDIKGQEKLYVSLIQAKVNDNILFCYLVSIIVFELDSGENKGTNENESKFYDYLKENDFFQSMKISEGFKENVDKLRSKHLFINRIISYEN